MMMRRVARTQRVAAGDLILGRGSLLAAMILSILCIMPKECLLTVHPENMNLWHVCVGASGCYVLAQDIQCTLFYDLNK